MMSMAVNEKMKNFAITLAGGNGITRIILLIRTYVLIYYYLLSLQGIFFKFSLTPLTPLTNFCGMACQAGLSLFLAIDNCQWLSMAGYPLQGKNYGGLVTLKLNH